MTVDTTPAQIESENASKTRPPRASCDKLIKFVADIHGYPLIISRYVARQAYSSPLGSNPSFSAFGKDPRPSRITLRPGTSRIEQESSVELPSGAVQGSRAPQFSASPQNLR